MAATDIDQAKRFLREHGWLSETPAEFADALLARSTLKTAKRREVIYRIADPLDGLRGMVSGGIAVEIATNETGPNLVHIFRSGAWIGEAEQFDGRPRMVTLIATCDSAFVHVGQRDLEDICAKKPETWRWLGLLATQHIDVSLCVIDDSMLRAPSHRIGAILLRLADQRMADNPNDTCPAIDITQGELAILANMSRATVATHLVDLEKDKLISRTYGCIVVLKPGVLRARLIQDAYAP
jgi:CRP/FNR family transcriptional regulator, cyclic AMP receptor protein